MESGKTCTLFIYCILCYRFSRFLSWRHEYVLVNKFCPRCACTGWAASEFSKNSQMRGGNRPPSACNDPRYQEQQGFCFAARHCRRMLRVLVCLSDGEGRAHPPPYKVLCDEGRKKMRIVRMACQLCLCYYVPSCLFLLAHALPRRKFC